MIPTQTWVWDSALFSSGDKAKYQEAANYLQKFVDKAPDDHQVQELTRRQSWQS